MDSIAITNFQERIIDLIEIGDFVNGSMVYEKLEDGRVHIMRGSLLDNENIKTILTKEQYQQNCYRVEE